MNKDLNNLETYNYYLPSELIAQYPCDIRDKSRLLCYDREKEEITHKTFNDLKHLLSKNDVLVLNNTKVLQARFRAQRSAAKGEPRSQSEREIRDKNILIKEEKNEIEILLIKPQTTDNLTWQVLAKPHKKFRSSKTLKVNSIEIEVLDEQNIQFKNYNDLKTILNTVGEMPLPPYIKRDLHSDLTSHLSSLDADRYQTVFAKEPGAVAAPTASLHFTKELLEELKNKGVEILYLTLHVGPGTFMPIRTENVLDHKLISEQFSIENKTWERILQAKKDKKNIIACGTTVVRTLEYLNLELRDKTSDPKKESEIITGQCDLFITPRFKFGLVDSIITNFHLPKTSLLLLISAFIGWDKVKHIYEEAIKEKYRFFSYGDAMIITATEK